MIYLIFTLFLLALFVLLISFIAGRKAKSVKRINSILEGKITYKDLHRSARAIFSRELNLAGKPDYIVKTKEGYIPVEFKSTTAENPFDNHVMQLLSYCVLVEEKFKTAVPRGFLVYGDGSQHQINYTSNSKLKLEKILEDMRKVLKSDKAERNHDNASKCLNCSFREVCPEKLQ